MVLCYGCQNRYKVYPVKERHCGGIPNIGNTCYVNSCLQISARLYPDLFRHMQNDLGHYGQAIVNKITNDSSQEHVTAGEAQQFCNTLLDGYNKDKTEKLTPGAQQDAAPVFDFILSEGGTQPIALYATTVDPNNTYPAVTNNTPDNYIFLNIRFPEESSENNEEKREASDHTAYSMDALVANALRGNPVEGYIWEHRQNTGEQIRGNALAGSRLSFSNLHGLNNRILPIWAHRFIQASNHNPRSATKITIPIINPFTLTIASDYLREDSGPYSSRLVGFILQRGSLNCGHYIAYLKSKADKWMRYDDETVTELYEEPISEAQAAYLYFYQANTDVRAEDK